jgi:3-isopropylmalate/(R)-2-methylmalate dehydratase large subunit
MSQTLFDKLWEAHQVRPETTEAPALVHVDLHLIHEVTSPQAFAELDERGLKVRRPDLTVATMDHSTPTWAADLQGQRRYASEQAWEQVRTLMDNCDRHGITLHDWDSPNRGVVHVMGPELGLTRPGMTIVCGDSHTSTHGAFGALAFGIGTSEVGHVLATQCLLQRRPRTLRITVDGRLGAGVSAKDLILHLIGRIGVDAGTGHVIEFAGSAIRALDMEGRMTVCNMAIEAGARAGLIAPDQTTIDWLRGRAHCPQGEAFEQAARGWLELASDPGATFDREYRFDADEIAPTITYGTHPGMVVALDQPVPTSNDPATRRALEYMQVTPGQSLLGRPVDVVFVGSCTNARLGDLRSAAEVMRGRRVAEGVRMLVVPGSEQVRKAAEAEGLDQVFIAAGAEWREPGCSMCIAMNGDRVGPGQTAVSTSNRNFEGRQGPGSRTFLASPATAAACAVNGCITDPRHLDGRPEPRIHFPAPRHMEARP